MKKKSALSIECGALVRELRLAAGFTQRSFANKLNTDFSYISMVERGAQNTKLVTLERMARAAGVSLGDFLETVAKRLPSK